MSSFLNNSIDMYKQQMQAVESLAEAQEVEKTDGLMSGDDDPSKVKDYVSDFVNYIRSKRAERAAEAEAEEQASKEAPRISITEDDVKAFEMELTTKYPGKLEDTKTPTLDFFQGQDEDATEDSIDLQANRLIDSAETTFEKPPKTIGALSDTTPLPKAIKESSPVTEEELPAAETSDGLMSLPKPKPRPADLDTSSKVDNTQFDMAVFNKIVSGESEDYNTVYGKSKVKPSKPITEMTVEEVRAWQDASVKAGSQSSAAGRFQIIRKTMDSLIKDGTLSKDDIFNEETQNKAFLSLLDRRNYSTYKKQIQEEDDPAKKKAIAKKLQNNLAKEFASIPVATAIPKSKKKGGWPKTDLVPGDTFYKDPNKPNLNKAAHSYEDFLKVLLEL